MDKYIRGKLIDLTGVSFQGHAWKTYIVLFITLNVRFEVNMHITEFLGQFSR